MFRKDIDKSCSYCMLGEVLKTSGDVLCKKYGITEPRDNCRKFKYAPLKRIPNVSLNLHTDLSAEDFSLDSKNKEE